MSDIPHLHIQDPLQVIGTTPTCTGTFQVMSITPTCMEHLQIMCTTPTCTGISSGQIYYIYKHRNLAWSDIPHIHVQDPLQVMCTMEWGYLQPRRYVYLTLL
jgi:hypothetical protein